MEEELGVDSYHIWEEIMINFESKKHIVQDYIRPFSFNSIMYSESIPPIVHTFPLCTLPFSLVPFVSREFHVICT